MLVVVEVVLIHVVGVAVAAAAAAAEVAVMKAAAVHVVSPRAEYALQVAVEAIVWMLCYQRPYARHLLEAAKGEHW